MVTTKLLDPKSTGTRDVINARVIATSEHRAFIFGLSGHFVLHVTIRFCVHMCSRRFAIRDRPSEFSHKEKPTALQQQMIGMMRQRELQRKAIELELSRTRAQDLLAQLQRYCRTSTSTSQRVRAMLTRRRCRASPKLISCEQELSELVDVLSHILNASHSALPTMILWKTHSVLGLSLEALIKYEESEKHLLKALTIASSAPMIMSTELLAVSFHQLGTTFLLSGNMRKCRSMYERALTAYEGCENHQDDIELIKQHMCFLEQIMPSASRRLSVIPEGQQCYYSVQRKAVATFNQY